MDEEEEAWRFIEIPPVRLPWAECLYGGDYGDWRGIRVGELGFFSISSLDFLFSKTSYFLPTLETLAQLNNYENNTFHNYYFWIVL